MFDLSWLIQLRFESLVRNEFNWNFVFSESISLRAECPWRLLESGRIRVSSDDHGHMFGLPATVDSAINVNARIAGQAIVAASVREGTLDLSITFASGHILELLPVSSGYEAWQIGTKDMLVIAVGGGELTVFTNGSEKDR